jgi:hypothetical protein
MIRRLRPHRRAQRKRITAQLQQELQALRTAYADLSARANQTSLHRNQLVNELRDRDERHAKDIEWERRTSVLAREFQRRLARMLHASCVAHNVPQHKVLRITQRLHDDTFMMQPPQMLLSYSAEDHYRAEAATMRLLEHEMMHLLGIGSVYDDVHRQMHLRVTLDRSQVRYAVSREALLRMPTDELAIQLADELAPALVLELKKQQGPMDWDERRWRDQQRLRREFSPVEPMPRHAYEVFR